MYRESARRTRQKRTVKLKDYEEKCGQLRIETNNIFAQMHETERHYVDTVTTNQALRSEVQAFRQARPEASAQVPATELCEPPAPTVLVAPGAAGEASPFPHLPEASGIDLPDSEHAAPPAEFAGLPYPDAAAEGDAPSHSGLPGASESAHEDDMEAARGHEALRPPPGSDDLYLPPSLFPGAAHDQPYPAVPLTPMGLPHPDDGAGPSEDALQGHDASLGHGAAPASLDFHTLIAARLKADSASGERPATDLTSTLCTLLHQHHHTHQSFSEARTK